MAGRDVWRCCCPRSLVHRSRAFFPSLLLWVARLFHLLRGSASKAFKIGIGARCDDEQDTGKHCEANSGLAQRLRRAACGRQLRDDLSYLGTSPRTHHAVAVNLN
jgi:hypothetical protein